MNQNNLTDLENLGNLKYRSSLLMPNKKDDLFDVVFSDSDRDRVKNLKTKLNELGYEVVHSEAFWDGC